MSKKINLDFNIERANKNITSNIILNSTDVENSHSSIKKVIQDIQENFIANSVIEQSKSEFEGNVPSYENKAIKILKLEKDNDFYIKNTLSLMPNRDDIRHYESGELILTEKFKEVQKTNMLFNMKLEKMLNEAFEVYQGKISQRYTEKETIDKFNEIYNELIIFIDTELKSYYEDITYLETYIGVLNDFDFNSYDERYMGYNKYER